MERCNISKSILSISSPGTHLYPGAGNDEAAQKLARRCNEYLAKIKRRRPEKFGFFATLPLPYVQGSFEEIAYALDELNADGFCVLSNHHGIYIGNAIYEPIWAELSRRKAKVFMHPTIPCMQVGEKLINALLQDFPLRSSSSSSKKFEWYLAYSPLEQSQSIPT